MGELLQRHTLQHQSLLAVKQKVGRGVGAAAKMLAEETAMAMLKKNPALSVCLVISIDLTAAGLPGLTVSVGVKGLVEYNICTRCYKWKIESVLGFEYAVGVGGLGLSLHANLKGELNTEEIPCSEAKGSRYCEYLDLFLAEEEAKASKKTRICHSASPFDTVTSYLKLRWRQVKK